MTRNTIDGIKLSGIFIKAGNSYDAEIFYSSRYTIKVRFSDKTGVANETVFESLSLTLKEKTHKFGQCRFEQISSGGESSGIIIFMDDLYDFNDLFYDNKITTLDSSSSNLNLILSQKEKVKTEFAEYISKLNYDLSVYQQFFDGIDKKMAPESEHVKLLLTSTVIKTAGNKFLNFFDLKVKELENMISDFSREEHEVHGFYLRKQLWHMILTSDLLMRTNVKPRGYAGDSEMMSMLYDTTYRGTSLFGKILYKYSLEHPAAQSVRNRRIMVPKILSEVRNEFCKTTTDNFSVMSVACGPAYELQDLFMINEDVAGFHFTLLDQDEEALGEAKSKVDYLEKHLNKKINVTYLNESVRTMLLTPKLDEKWGRFNFIYSMGLFDYLTPPVAKAVIEKIYHLLLPGGELLIGNYHVDNTSKWFMEYWHDWVLYHRTEDEFKNLLRDTNAVEIDVFLEQARCQMFLSAKKPL